MYVCIYVCFLAMLGDSSFLVLFDNIGEEKKRCPVLDLLPLCELLFVSAG